MTKERIIRVVKPKSLDGEVSIRIFFDYYLPNRQLAKVGFNIKDFDDLEPAPPKDWQERLHKVAELTQYISETGDGTEAGFNSIDVAISRLKDVATLKQQIKELEDANRYLARSNGKLILELRQKTPKYIDAALNEGDGVYRP
jgi:hypothetical protein